MMRFLLQLTDRYNLNRQILLRAVVALSIASIAAMLLRAETFTWDRAVLALAIIWVGLIPGILFLATPNEEREPFPLMPFVGLFYAVFFGLISFFGVFIRLTEDSPTLQTFSEQENMIQFFGIAFLEHISRTAQMLTLVGILLMYCSWWLVKRHLGRRLPKFTLPQQYPAWRMHLLIWGLVVGNLLYIHVPYVRTLPSIGQLLQPAGYIGFALMMTMAYRRELPKWQLCLYFCVAFPLWFLGLLTTGFLGPLMLIAGLWVGMHIFFRHRVPWGWILTLPLLLVMLYPVMVSFRGLTWEAGKGMNFIDRLGQLDTAVERALDYPDKLRHEQKAGLIRRAGLIFAFSHVVEQTPDPVPYWNGTTYKPLISSWIPRILWKDKPEEKTGYAFGARYSLFYKTDTHMSFNLPWITELYANFGTIGTTLGMAIIGLFLGLLECIFNRRSENLLEYGIGAGILLPLSFQDSNFTLMTGSLLPLATCLWLYFTIGLRFGVKRS